ncbi:Pkinase-domain-containing protein [Acaromyces ingoldii]|uniref:non-specific serine/threonine protein kinase n=1 Tax=Acaromyces ingoldii TaxID=215250 RepID=A0A316YR87_9BASI|nr:Pkinase-domain-containing protein [Acaromyces ingoldii]PWN90543.1 Pkinase-domain-containing protein [Acaromyces ingoldii]
MNTMNTVNSLNNQKSALSAAYAELGKELSTGRLRSVGAYTLGRPIGEGTFGKVRLGTHRLTGTRVAIKQVPKALSASLTREIHHHRRLHHPHVMQLFEVLATETNIWMVSELCAGGELYDYLVERGVMPEPEARRLFGQLCLATAYIHGRGIVHRDLKLENVLLDDRCNVKLGDFGFTREFEGKKLMETFCGTTGYAAPEMLAGKKYTGEEVDIWSLGVILYALLCGALPFDDDDDDVMKSKILKGDYELPEQLSEEARDLVSKILQQEPSARPSIKSILSHPWFSKIMATTPMATVEEHEGTEDLGYFANADADAEASKTGKEPSSAPRDALKAVDVNQDTIPSSAEATATASPAGSSAVLAAAGSSDEPSPAQSAQSKEGLHLQIGNHVGSSSGVSETSFHSAHSDGDSSDRRSQRTATTDPTTEEGETEGTAKEPHDRPESSAALALHRNESQTTIRRTSSSGSDSSRRAAVIAGKAAAAAASAPLPTHHEISSSPGSSPEGEDEEEASSAIKRPESAPLEKRSSQGSSMGHHRTPSRTKRRSFSGLSDHHPPMLDNRPIDYVAQLEQSSPALFSSTLEQNVLHQLSGLGMDVGQIVHSVVVDACDATGALWWMLKKKAEEKKALESPKATNVTPVATSSALGLPPPPLPPKDPARRAHEEAVRGDSIDQALLALTSLQQDRARRSPTEEKSNPMKPQAERRKSSSQRADGAKEGASVKSPRKKTLIDLARSSPLDPSGESSSSSSVNGGGSPSRPQRSTERNRTNSFSVRLSNVLKGQDRDGVSGSGASGSGQRRDSPDAVVIGDEELPLERSKSPVGAFFSSAKREDKEKKKAAKLDARLPLRKEATIKAAMPALETDKENNEKIVPTSSTTSSFASSPARSSGKEKERDTVVEREPTASQSVETFSTVTSSNEERSSSRTLSDSTSPTKGARAKASFLTTVRNWLGTEDKATMRRKAKFKGQKHPPSNLGHAGPSATSQTMARTGSVRSRNSPYPPPSAGSVSRRSPRQTLAHQRGSLSRRSSSGSAYGYEGAPSASARPVSMRRLSAGSITPTGTGSLFAEDFGSVPLTASSQRSSRPGSAQSFNRQPQSGLRGRTGSVSSTGSLMRQQQQGGGVHGSAAGASTYSGSLRGIHTRRPSDGGSTVRRHRKYPSSTHSLRARSESDEISRPSTPTRHDEAREGGPVATQTPRRSIDSSVEVGAETRSRALSSPETPRQSVFVAHRSRTPYKPPSANASLHHHSSSTSSSLSSHPSHLHPHHHQHSHSLPTDPLASARKSAVSSASGTVATARAAATESAPKAATWRRSWGRPPPNWAGFVDPPQPPARSTSKANHGAGEDGMPKLRDVFADKSSRSGHGGLSEDDGWEDEDEEGDEPVYAGGLGQLNSWASSVGAARASQWAMGDAASTSSSLSPQTPGFNNSSMASRRATSSPFTTRTSAAAPNVFPGSMEAPRGGASGGFASSTGRYAGVRSLFQPPSLGRETMPRLLSATMPALASGATGGKGSDGGPPSTSGASERGPSPTLKNSPAITTTLSEKEAAGSAGSTRTRTGPPSAFASVKTIEEEEED